MQKTQKQFQDACKRLIDRRRFTLQEQKETSAWIKGYRENTYTFQLLEEETEQFQKENEDITDVMITNFSEEKEPISDEITIEFRLNGKWYGLAAQILDLTIIDEITIHFYIQIEGSTQIVGLKYEALPDETKKGLLNVFHQCKRLIASMPAYRLYFATQDIQFHDLDELAWLKGE